MIAYFKFYFFHTSLYCCKFYRDQSHILTYPPKAFLQKLHIYCKRIYWQSKLICTHADTNELKRVFLKANYATVAVIDFLEKLV